MNTFLNNRIMFYAYFKTYNYASPRVILKYKKEPQEESFITATVYSENVMPLLPFFMFIPKREYYV